MIGLVWLNINKQLVSNIIAAGGPMFIDTMIELSEKLRH